MKTLFFVLLLAGASGAALAQSAPPTGQPLRSLQLRLNERQQQLQQLQTRPSTPAQDAAIRRLQQQLEEQQLELQRLQRQQRSCPPPGPC